MKDGLIKIKDFLENERDLIDSYALIGGIAVGSWVPPRATKDIDLLFVFKSGKTATVESLKNRLEKNGWEVTVRKGDFEDNLPFSISITDENGETIDLIPSTHKWEEKIVADAEKLLIFNEIELPVVNPEGLIVLKLKAGGPQDIVDIGTLLLKRGINKEKLNNLAKKARVDKNLAKLLGKLKLDL